MDGITNATTFLEARVPPFRRLPRGEQVMLALSIAAGEMGKRIEEILRSRQRILTQARYNALRILRGAGHAGLSCSDICSRLLLTPPNVTRLMDPLVECGLVSRAPDPGDRRVILQRLTPAGHEALADLDQRLSSVYEAITSGLGPEMIAQLVDGCERVIEVAYSLDAPAADALRDVTRA